MVIRKTALALMAAWLPALPALALETDANQQAAGETVPPATAALPALAGRDPSATLPIRGFRVTGVADHPQQGVSPASMQAVADAYFADVAAGADTAALSFEQLQAAADAVTAAYRQAGFLVSVAYLPQQSLGPDQHLEIRVMEGRIGKVIVQGNQRYQSQTVGGAAQGLIGHPLRKADIETALLYARDLPGVSVSSILQPGENEGETDLVLVANEKSRPWEVSLSVDNHGTPTSGRGRVQAGLIWNNPLGRGDVLAASGNYQFSPAASRNGALSYSLPIRALPGLSVLAGANQSELEINSGPLAVLELSGPSSQQYAGADWKFINAAALQMTASARYIQEASRFESLGMRLSDHRFDVAELGVGLRHFDGRWRGANLLQLSVRRSLDDDSGQLDVVSPNRDSHFTVARLGLMRMQHLSRNQRLLARFNGQFTGNGLPAMEQFQLGGNDSVRGYANSEALGDRGYLLGLEWHMDAPGFADTPSPFQGLAWREVFSVDLFADHGQVSNVTGNAPDVRLSSAGAGMTLRLQRWRNLEVRLAGALPIGSAKANDGRNARFYARASMTF